MVTTKEDIEMCMMLHRWHTEKDDSKVYKIELTLSGDLIIRAHIYVLSIMYDDNKVFTYERPQSYSVDVTTDNFKSFEREYKIDQVLNDDDIEISMDKYQSMLTKVTNNYYTALIKYIKSLSIGDPVWFNNNRCEIYKPHRKQKLGRINLYDLDNHKIIKNVTVDKLQPRTTDEIKVMMDNFKFPLDFNPLEPHQ